MGGSVKPWWYRLYSLWHKKSPPSKSRLLLQALPQAINLSEIPRYPPFSEGLPATSVEAILASQSRLIERLQATLGLTLEEFAQWVQPVLRRYAAFVHLLPASEHHHHSGAGGLWRHSLEVAVGAAQASEAVMFSTHEAPQLRRELAPRWRLAAGLAGLLHDAGKPLSDLTVVDRAGELTWNPYFEDCIAWATRHKIKRYRIQWATRQPKRHQIFAVLCVDRLLPPATTAYLSALGTQPMASLLETLTGQAGDPSLLQLVQQADQASVSQDLKRNGLGTTVEHYVLGVIRRFVQSGHWQVNAPDAKIWHFTQGTFLDWGRGFPDVLARIRQDQAPGVPQELDRLADFLIERGVAQPSCIEDSQGSYATRYWRVALPLQPAGEASTQRWLLRLTAPEWIFITEVPAPWEGGVVESHRVEQEVEERQHRHAQEQKAPPITPSPLRVSPEIPGKAKPAPITPTLTACETLSAQFNDYGAAAPLLRAAIDPLLAGHQPLGFMIDQLDGHIVMPYPEGVRPLGNPMEVVTILFEAGAIAPDLMSPDRKVRTIQGRKVLVLTDALSAAMAAALNEVKQKTALSSMAALSPSARTQNGQAKSEFDHTPRASETSSSARTQTLAPTASPITPEQAIAQLIDMIRLGKGPWLVSPVIQENGRWITDARCLAQLAKAHPDFSLPLLRLTLRNLEKDRARLEGGKLILEAASNG
jgi:hypothetical protein